MKHTYSGNINIDVYNKSITADLKIDVSEINESQIIYYLNGNMVIENIAPVGNENFVIGDKIVDWNPFFKNTKELKVIIPVLHDRAGFQIKYSGNIDSTIINNISQEWTELGIYAPWFPLNPNLEEISFNMDIEYSGSSSCNLIYPNKTCSIQDIDFPIFISNQFMTTEYPSSKIKVYIHNLKESKLTLVNLVREEVISILDYYSSSFGEIVNLEDLNIIIAPRVEGGGYCRKNLIVISLEDCETEEEILRFKLYLAHELAHMWWNKADVSSWEDWLNESFAEYSTLLYLKDKHGTEYYEQEIIKLKKEVENLPCIYKMARVSDLSYEILNYKGPLILSQFHKAIGDKQFIHLLRDMVENKIYTTEVLLQHIEKGISKEARYLLENELKL